jgi:hypothetical protein
VHEEVSSLSIFTKEFAFSERLVTSEGTSKSETLWRLSQKCISQVEVGPSFLQLYYVLCSSHGVILTALIFQPGALHTVLVSVRQWQDRQGLAVVAVIQLLSSSTTWISCVTVLSFNKTGWWVDKEGRHLSLFPRTLWLHISFELVWWSHTIDMEGTRKTQAEGCNLLLNFFSPQERSAHVLHVPLPCTKSETKVSCYSLRNTWLFSLPLTLLLAKFSNPFFFPEKEF